MVAPVVGSATTWADLLAQAQAGLGSATEARRIVASAAGWEWAALQLHLHDEVTDEAARAFRDMVARRAVGEPLQYVLGGWGFRSLDLIVDRRALIPRPETEIVVDVVLDELRRLHVERPLVADLGTGTGAVALSLAVEAAPIDVWAVDVSRDALDLATENLQRLPFPVRQAVHLVEGSWFAALPAGQRGRFDLLVSNPPYVAEADVLEPAVADWEPGLALVSGPTGMEAIEVIVTEAPRWLTRPGTVVLEVDARRSEWAAALAGGAGFDEVTIVPDLAGRPRVLVARRSSQADGVQ